MPRIQVLELPRKSVDEEIPFLLIVDRLEMVELRAWQGDAPVARLPLEALEPWMDDLREVSGARGVIAVPGDVEVG